MTRFCLLFLLFMPSILYAVNWAELEVDDPILKGEKCSVHEPMSYGSYIYRWSSKYDLVFWPDIDNLGIWYCEKSGFTSFMHNFSDVSEDEVASIRKYLAENSEQDPTIQSKLQLLEKLYALRNTDNAFDNRLLRILARWYQELGDIERANNYRKQALAGIKAMLAKEVDETRKLEYLYLASAYSRQFGDVIASEDYLFKFKELAVSIKREESQDFVEYMRNLASEVDNIKEGGVLDPSP